MRWETTLTPHGTGEYTLGFRGDGFFRVSLDGKTVILAYHTNGVETKVGPAHLEAGKPYALKVDYQRAEGATEPGQLVWSKFDPRPSPEAPCGGEGC